MNATICEMLFVSRRGRRGILLIDVRRSMPVYVRCFLSRAEGAEDTEAFY